jgi:hypothetical protein
MEGPHRIHSESDVDRFHQLAVRPSCLSTAPSNELDLFLLFLKGGLYFEPDPRQLAEALPWSAPPSTGDMRRYKNQHPQLVPSQTQLLDDWYESQLSLDDHPADKPRFVGDQKLLHLVDTIASTGQAGWLSTGTSLLEGNGRVQKAFGRYATDLAKLVRQDRQHHSITHLVGEISCKHTLLVWACHGPDEDPETATSYLLSYLKAKKYQTGAYRAACMLFDPSGQHLQRLLCGNTPSQPDSGLDESVARLMPLEQMKRKTPDLAVHGRLAAETVRLRNRPLMHGRQVPSLPFEEAGRDV